MVDYTAWAKVDVFKVEEAARLWAGLDPESLLLGKDRQAFAPCFRMIFSGIERGELPADHGGFEPFYAATAKILEYRTSYVTRKDLRAFAASKGERPRFLFFDDPLPVRPPPRTTNAPPPPPTVKGRSMPWPPPSPAPSPISDPTPAPEPASAGPSTRGGNRALGDEEFVDKVIAEHPKHPSWSAAARAVVNLGGVPGGGTDLAKETRLALKAAKKANHGKR